MTQPVVTRLPGSIIIARHGEPDADRRMVLDWRGYEKWWADYDLAGLKNGQSAPKALCEAAGQAHSVYASTLIRAIETAQACVGTREITQNSVFIEAPLPPPPIPGRFKARTWGVYARCTWWLGMARGKETRAQAETRAEEAAAILIEAAQHGDVALFAHGWFNRMLRPVLKRHGYVCVRDGGDDYWSWRKYEIKGRS
ncbi:histidine phosphatase family protein [Glycocaulis sp.]|uniref:histidine phosphatase family protein n=1 Tax=Glycocaulis sp. TaxID=1969725 RepID=UPI003D1E9085